MKRSSCVGRWTLVAVALLLAIASTSLACAATGNTPASLSKYRCYDCHADRETVAGPAFADIAAAYRGKADAVARIASEIRSGMRGGGPWHMPPHPEVSANDARAMARYILSLDGKDAAPREASGH
jgi:cytochrome c